jgi:hypothetical protein
MDNVHRISQLLKGDVGLQLTTDVAAPARINHPVR